MPNYSQSLSFMSPRIFRMSYFTSHTHTHTQKITFSGKQNEHMLMIHVGISKYWIELGGNICLSNSNI